jgi:hypothetical protein
LNRGEGFFAPFLKSKSAAKTQRRRESLNRPGKYSRRGAVAAEAGVKK